MLDVTIFRDDDEVATHCRCIGIPELEPFCTISVSLLLPGKDVFRYYRGNAGCPSQRIQCCVIDHGSVELYSGATSDHLLTYAHGKCPLVPNHDVVELFSRRISYKSPHLLFQVFSKISSPKTLDLGRTTVHMAGYTGYQYSQVEAEGIGVNHPISC